MNIGDNSYIDKVDECIIYQSAVNRARVKDGKVSVFDTGGMKVRVGVSASMQSHAIDGVTLFAASLDGHTISD
jgi:hypothetical protein